MMSENLFQCHKVELSCWWWTDNNFTPHFFPQNVIGPFNQVCLVHHQKPKKNGVYSPNFMTNKSTMRLQFSFCWLVILSTFSAIWLFASKVSGASLFDLGCGRCTCSDGSLCSSTGNFMYASRCACTDNGCPSGSEYKDGGAYNILMLRTTIMFSIQFKITFDCCI